MNTSPTFSWNLLVCLIALFGANANAASDSVIHPAPKTPRLMKANLLPEFKKGMTLPPVKGSEAQTADEVELLKRQKERDQKSCDRAQSEVFVSLASFYGQPYGPLSEAEVTSLAPFFDQVRNDGDYYIQLLKKEFPRQRPFLYMQDLTPCVPKEVTGAYPSGHATLAKLYALILSDLFPTQKKTFEERANVIATDRVLSGMHHPTDIQAGAQLGERLYQELKKSPSYQKLFKTLSVKGKTS